jgi:hypothetical protein
MRVSFLSSIIMTMSISEMSFAFAPMGRSIHTSRCETVCRVETMTVNNDFGTAVPTLTDVDPYIQFGLSGPDDLALGVDINDLIKWVGTYVMIH